MKIFEEQRRVIITCNKRLSVFLEKEVRAIGFIPQRVFATGVELKASVRECIRMNLHLLCASQIHYSLGQFRVQSPEDLYQALVKFQWENLLTEGTYFSVTSHVDHFTVNNPLFVNVRVKDAIVDRFRKIKGTRPNSGPELNGAVIHLYWKEDTAEIFLDTSGETLAKHGYRKIPGQAPMLEALAAGTLLASRWDYTSPFVNPMCGSGTLAIEAAMLATNRKPGLFRENYSFMHVQGFEEKFYREEREAIVSAITDTAPQIIATDHSTDAIDISRVNARMAGVEDLISFRVCDFAETEVPEGKPGVVFLNPEYGDRMGDVNELEETYGRIGDFLKKNCKGYTGYIFTGNLDLAKKIGLKATRRIEFYSAKLDCRLLEYELYSGTKRVEAGVTPV